MALGSTQPLTEMSTSNYSWSKVGLCVGLTTLQPACADCLDIWEHEPPGNLRSSKIVHTRVFATIVAQEIILVIWYAGAVTLPSARRRV
jgi:hypothetical protein